MISLKHQNINIINNTIGIRTIMDATLMFCEVNLCWFLFIYLLLQWFLYCSSYVGVPFVLAFFSGAT